jgi:NTE family protein
MRRGGATLASYMLFDYRYCKALIAMGYEDTMKRRDEIAIFFDPAACPLPTVIPYHSFDPGKSQTMAATKL